MENNLIASQKVGMSEEEICKKYNIDLILWRNLKSNIYPDSSDEAIIRAIDFCRSYKVDIRSKPVHIVKRDKREYLWSSIGLYRELAERSNSYAGIDKPEYGPEITLGGIKYPQWCSVTVKKIVQGQICNFTAMQFWLENYGKDSKGQPNWFWTIRPYGQLIKCTEAQVLRMAFTTIIPAEPIFEEMDGKVIYEHGESYNDIFNSNNVVFLDEKKNDSKNLIKRLITLCEDEGLKSGSFATFHNISSNNIKSVENAINNFPALVRQYHEQHNNTSSTTAES